MNTVHFLIVPDTVFFILKLKNCLGYACSSIYISIVIYGKSSGDNPNPNKWGHAFTYFFLTIATFDGEFSFKFITYTDMYTSINEYFRYEYKHIGSSSMKGFLCRFHLTEVSHGGESGGKTKTHLLNKLDLTSFCWYKNTWTAWKQTRIAFPKIYVSVTKVIRESLVHWIRIHRLLFKSGSFLIWHSYSWLLWYLGVTTCEV